MSIWPSRCPGSTSTTSTGYYDYPYWGYEGAWGLEGAGRAPVSPPERPAEPSADVHLRSANEVQGYEVYGSDGAIGHIDDFIVDDQSWELRYLVIDTSYWWFGKKVLVAPTWASTINWHERKIDFDLSRQQIKDSPTWIGTAALQRDYEQRLHEHYRRPGYWGGGAAPAPHESEARV